MVTIVFSSFSGLTREFGRVLGAARVLTDRRRATVVERLEIVEDVETRHFQSAADIFRCVGAPVYAFEGVVVTLDRAYAPGRTRGRITRPLVVKHTGEAGDGVSHPRRIVGGIVRHRRGIIVGIETADIVDRGVLVVQGRRHR